MQNQDIVLMMGAQLVFLIITSFGFIFCMWLIKRMIFDRV